MDVVASGKGAGAASEEGCMIETCVGEGAGCWVELSGHCLYR